MTRRIVMAAASVLLAACAATSPPSAPPAGIATAFDPEILAQLADRYPASRERLPTTDGAIHSGNLDARIDGLRAAIERGDVPRLRTWLASALLQRFRIVGRVADGEAALREVDVALAADPAAGEALMVRAAALSAFHRFAEARVALDAAARAGTDGATLARIRRDLDAAEGRYDRLAGDIARSAEPVADFYELAHRADLRIQLGDLAGATHLYRAAQDLVFDVDPLPVAWLFTQQGIALLRFGEVAEARRFFAAAHARLPAYTLAAEHLAECESLEGNFDAARALYRDVIARSGNPEFTAALAQVEGAAGEVAAAEALRASARSGYRELLSRHRDAYLQHAAQFELDTGNPEAAFALARDNVALRADVGSLILLAQAADAASDEVVACDAHGRAIATGLRPPELGELGTLAARCARLPAGTRLDSPRQESGRQKLSRRNGASADSWRLSNEAHRGAM
jgi:tetratricopeptide (TPR) repeat protein